MELNKKQSIFESSEDLKSNYDPKNNKTSSLLNKYEKTRIIGIRMQQLAQGCNPYIDKSKLDDKSYTSVATEELIQKKLPFMIKRTLPNGKFEYWKLDDMDIL